LLTDENILDISDELFETTLAYNIFGNKQIFISKIKDETIRYKMLKNIIQPKI